MFTNTFLFPDVNVWLALSHAIHPHYQRAVAWSETIGTATPIYFCRFTQLGYLRLLTTRAAMGAEVLTQAQAWNALDTLLRNPNIEILDEPDGIHQIFRRLTDRDETSPKHWADGYLAAFAIASGLTLVTFDDALARRVRGSVRL